LSEARAERPWGENGHALRTDTYSLVPITLPRNAQIGC
jgi:hypothetical protein